MRWSRVVTTWRWGWRGRTTGRIVRYLNLSLASCVFFGTGFFSTEEHERWSTWDACEETHSSSSSTSDDCWTQRGLPCALFDGTLLFFVAFALGLFLVGLDCLVRFPSPLWVVRSFFTAWLVAAALESERLPLPLPFIFCLLGVGAIIKNNNSKVEHQQKHFETVHSYATIQWRCGVAEPRGCHSVYDLNLDSYWNAVC